MKERLNKIISSAGVCSRREADRLIKNGFVVVNGIKIEELGTKADPEVDEIKVRGNIISAPEKIYILLNKPVGYLCTLKDEFGRDKVTDLIKGIHQRVYPVGRLDKDTEGLLILTNDGDFANLLTNPRKNCPKKYIAVVKGHPKEKDLDLLRQGINIDDITTRKCKIVRLQEDHASTAVEVILTEGKKRQIRKMFSTIGHPVLKLTRTAIGELTDPYLKPGNFRFLKKEEIKKFRK